ncbi:hypothetical protein [Chryseobacterium paridis]|uniref:Lipoprotein n=1 Tax=Chryseobacterium paridis TaxID=2800328 RepID=A0ABS1FTR0_9FLAO|nr:hypothetical protein [Chryseobacterium paridis]MBK1895825.1 hypothetical protein [Chryseobacterium paridis]
MNKILILLFTLLLISCSEKEKKSDSKIVDKTIGFSMIVPGSFSKLDEESKKEQIQKGVKRLDKLHDSAFALSDIKNTILFKSDDENLFVLNNQDYDVKTQGDYNEAIKGINDLSYQTQSMNFPNANIDSVTSKEMIDGVEFSKFILSTKISETKTMHMVKYNKLFKDKDFTASVVFTNDELGREVIKAFKDSKFKK